MPPVVTGAIVAAIGLVLAPIAIDSASGIGAGKPDGSAFARWIALITVMAVGLFASTRQGSGGACRSCSGQSSAISSTSSRRT